MANIKPILFEEGAWRNSPLSVAKYYGGINAFGASYTIVNKRGITLAELSDPRSKHYVGDGMAIPPGEPADLVLTSWVPIYRKLGREKTHELIKSGVSLKEAKAIAKGNASRRDM